MKTWTVLIASCPSSLDAQLLEDSYSQNESLEVRFLASITNRSFLLGLITYPLEMVEDGTIEQPYFRVQFSSQPSKHFLPLDVWLWLLVIFLTQHIFLITGCKQQSHEVQGTWVFHLPALLVSDYDVFCRHSIRAHQTVGLAGKGMSSTKSLQWTWSLGQFDYGSSVFHCRMNLINARHGLYIRQS